MEIQDLQYSYFLMGKARMNDAFENWFSSMWLGDGSINETIPTKQSDPRYKDYLAEHCLALGAWKACEEHFRCEIQNMKQVIQDQKKLGEAADAGHRAAMDDVYAERNKCVALIAKLAINNGWVAGVSKTAIEGWDEEWNNCVYINLPTGQVSWHFHDQDREFFSALPGYMGEWDGHSTKEKYNRIVRLIQSSK